LPHGNHATDSNYPAAVVRLPSGAWFALRLVLGAPNAWCQTHFTRNRRQSWQPGWTWPNAESKASL